MHKLSKRLEAIFQLVPVSAKVADIGTDHAYLPIALSLSGKCSKIIACDIKERPLENARENIEKFSVNDIETRLGNGLEPIKSGEVDTVIIAGMGGDVISGIIGSCPWIKNSDITLLLQPMTSAEVLRKYLCKNGFEISLEVPLSENGKIYTVIKAFYSGKVISFDDGYYYTGKINAKTSDGRAYIEKQLRRIDDCINDLSRTDNLKSVFKYVEIKNYINNLLEI
ncbi:MAG: SAM-dependent methyltransferase [Ruminococcaceae bacterium]|nr:SAM-dependent methyltransferase [Oscillospiraceae bacterium]